MKILCGPANSSWAKIGRSLSAKYGVEVVANARDTTQELIVPAELLGNITKEYPHLYIVISTSFQTKKVVEFLDTYRGLVSIIWHTSVSKSPLINHPSTSIDLLSISSWSKILTGQTREETIQTPKLCSNSTTKINLQHLPLLEREEVKKIAFLVLAHKDTPQLEWMCRNLNTDKSTLFIHFDAKYPIPDYCKSAVVVPHRTAIEWSEPEMILATINSLQYIETSGIDYQHLFLLSGEDLTLTNVNNLISEIDYDVYMNVEEIQRNSCVTQINRTAKVAKRYFIPNNPFDRIRCGFGSQWFSCSRRAVRYLLAHPDTPLLVDFYRNTRFSDESFFQTFFMNSPLDICRDNKRYMVWAGDKHPEYLDNVSIPSGYWFSRKVSTKLPTFTNIYTPPKTSATHQSGIYCGESQTKSFLVKAQPKTTTHCSVFFIKSTTQVSLAKEAIEATHGDCILVISDNVDTASINIPNCTVVTYSSANFLGKVFGLNLGTFIALNMGYSKLFISMCDVVLRSGCFDKLLACDTFSVPFFYTNGKTNQDGQWDGMETQQMLHYELLCWLVPADIVSVCRPSDKFPTSWATGFKYGIDLHKRGYVLTKQCDIVADHKGGTTFGVKTVESQFRDRAAYHKAGATELLLLLKHYYRNSMYLLLQDLAHTGSFIAETSRWKWLWYQLESIDKYKVTPKMPKSDITVFVFHSLYQGGIEKVWASLGHTFKKLGKNALFIYWDDRQPHADFESLAKIRINRKDLQTVLALVNPKNLVACGWPRDLHNICAKLNIRKFSYVASPDYNKTECNGTTKIFESQQLLEPNGIYLPQITTVLPHNEQPRTYISRVGRICNSKNPVLFGEISSRFPKIPFVWVGGPEKGEEELFEHVKTVYPNVKWLGNSGRETVLDYLSRSIVSLSTTHTHAGSKEGIPNAILESLACGTPVISTDSGNCKEVATMIVEDNVDAFVSAIQSIQHTKLDTVCRKLIEERCNIAKIEATICEVF